MVHSGVRMRNCLHRHRRGMAAVIAMLFLAIFGTLAVGFYAAATTSVQVSSNEQRVLRASMAAESGMDFMRYQLARISIPYGVPQEWIFPLLYLQLQANMQNTGNLSGRIIWWGGTVIHVPATYNRPIVLDAAQGSFRASIYNLGQKVRVKVTGTGPDGRTTRAVQLDYALAQRASAIFDYGIASRGKVTTEGASRVRGATDPTKGSILSTCMSDPTPVVIKGKEVSGDISVVNPNANVSIQNGASVGGTTNLQEIYASHVHKGVQEPEFPTVDTSAFAAYATSVYTGGNTLVNCRIPANTNPTFAGNATIRGVLYVETPNRITFRGNVDIQGVIVVQNSPTGTIDSNVLDFSGSVSARGVETLPESYGNLRKMTGSFILAPKFHVKFSGDFGTVNGSMLADKFSMTGNATGTVMGSVINLADNAMTVSGSSEIIIASTGTTNYPAGVFFSSNFAPLSDTYEEVQP